MILWYILRTNVLLLNLWFRVLPVEEVIRLNDLSLSSHCVLGRPLVAWTCQSSRHSEYFLSQRWLPCKL